MFNFTSQLADVVFLALRAINDYDGEKAVTLPTGEKAIDNDDAWIIINREDEPICRDKREQRVRETYAKEGREYDDGNSTDCYLLDNWTYEDICDFADRLLDQ